MTAPAAIAIRWGADGLVPVVAVDAATGEVLMVASMNAEALARSRETGIVHYWSRSRRELWRKGATSGHEQRLVEVRINCNRDSLLLVVEQTGAVCHDGYPTCYYRRLADDDTATVIGERVFDPAEVYGAGSGDDREPVLVARWLGAYAFLNDDAFTPISNTARLLGSVEDRVSGRVADELEELAGVLDGSHQHRSFAEDVALEATQCLYWCALTAIRTGAARHTLWSAERVRLAGDMSLLGLADTLRAAAERWRSLQQDEGRLLETIDLVRAVVAHAGIDPLSLIRADLDDLGARPYLAPYFAAPLAAAP